MDKKINTNFFTTKKGIIVMTVVGYILQWALLLLLSETFLGALTYVFAIPCVILGWSYLRTSWLQQWLITIREKYYGGYFVIKFFLAIILGLIIAPYQLAKIIAERISDRSSEKGGHA